MENRDVTEVGGLRVVSAPDTWGDLAGLWTLDDLLAAADVLLRRGITSPAGLAASAHRRRGRPHAADLAIVAGLARAGAAAPAESRARFVFWSWGLPEPELNVSVLNDDGEWLATSDFLWRQQRVVGEYDGDVHRTDRRTWQRDRERRAALEDAGHTYVEMADTSFRHGHPRRGPPPAPDPPPGLIPPARRATRGGQWPSGNRAKGPWPPLAPPDAGRGHTTRTRTA